jgi:hypothetical protein
MTNSNKITNWLLKGDPSIRWQTLRDLLGAQERVWQKERRRIAKEGWGKRLLARQEPSGRWGGGLYSPKWISTTYTMMLLRHMGLPPGHPQAMKACRFLLDNGFYRDGGINISVSYKYSETCVTGMFLAILAQFRLPDRRLDALVEHLLGQQMRDGGWNCESFKGATHSSFHTTINVLEGLREYQKFHPRKYPEARRVQEKGREFLLKHRLFRSSRTGQVVRPEMTRFSFPPRWHYDVLRGLDHFQEVRAKKDKRLRDAIELLYRKRKKDGRWVLQNRYAGRTFFEMEKIARPSRWNTLRALRVVKWWEGWR